MSIIKTAFIVFKYSTFSKIDDCIGGLLHGFTSLLFLTYATIVFFRFWVQDLFLCWENAYDLEKWNEYIATYCHIEDKYFVSPHQTEFPIENREVSANFYYWIPLLFIAQAIFCNLPFWIWYSFNYYSGIHIKTWTGFLAGKKDQEVKNDINIAKKFVKTMKFNIARRDYAVDNGIFKLINYKNYFSNLYCFYKLLNIVIVIAQMMVLKWSSSARYEMFGIEMILNWYYKNDWKKTGYFARIMYCDFNRFDEMTGKPMNWTSATSDNVFFLVNRVEETMVSVFAVGNAFSNNCIDKILLHASMVARDQNEQVSISLSLYDGCNDLKSKYIVLTMFNVVVHHGSSVPEKIENILIPNQVDMPFILQLAKKKGLKLTVKRKKVELFCCCNRPSFTLSEERNSKIANDTMIQCTECQRWRFFKCGAVASTSNKDWFCWECHNGLPAMVDHCNLHSCKFENTCPLDSVISACHIYNVENDGILSKTIDTYDRKSVFEDALQVFLASDINTQLTMEEAKHIFLKKVFKKQRDLEGFEETIVLRHFKERYLAIGDYNCPDCQNSGTTVVEDYLFLNEINDNVAFTIAEAMQPENFDMCTMCCDKFLAIFDKKYAVPIPWVLPLRILQFPFLRTFTPEKIEELPLEVDVFNNNEVIGYKLGLISFSKPGHFAALIPCKNGWILYDSLKDPLLLPLRTAIQQITNENGTINCFYYFINKMPKIKKSQSTKKR